ncbi:MAG: tetratricopeptide repeat protein, partial [Bacteroidetes bacterium]|nr:tetratricopeptide repeat protein [Bacteroidota bacterium]
TDAQTFYNFMVSPTGGSVAPENAKVLLNEKASAANIFATLDWLVDATTEGETVIFYFAGHGDLENKTMFQNGFLLASDAPIAAYMAGGTVGVMYLQQYLTTLVQKNKSKVILITDACHSGKLAGGLEGVANTATALQGNWENTIKILSSQPGELSQEGTKWNGGGGVFTYYLVKGLMGFADRNHDSKITVNEMNIYLMDKVPTETNFSQNPSIQGNPTAVLAMIDSTAFAIIEGNEKDIKLNNNAIAMRGNEEDLKKKLDTATYNTYIKFKYCLAHNYLFGNHPGYGNALDLYNKLKENKNADIVILSAKRSLIAAMQNPVQIALNSILSGVEPPDSIPIQEMYAGIETAYRLSDSADISYNSIKARYLLIKAFFSGASNNGDEGLKLLAEVIRIDPDFAPGYYVRGSFLQRLGRTEEALTDFQKALDLCPRWTWAYNAVGDILMDMGQFEESADIYQKCIELNPGYGPAYSHLSFIYSTKKDTLKSQQYLSKWDSVEVSNKNAEAMSAIGNVYRDNLHDTIKAREKYVLAISFDEKYAEAYYEQSKLVSTKSSEAENLREKFIKLKTEELSEILNRDPRNLDVMSEFAQAYTLVKDYKNALVYYEKFLCFRPTDKSTLYNVSCLYSLQNMTKEAVINLESAIINGWTDFDHIAKDTDLDNIRNTEEFKNLIKKYNQ